MSQRPRIVFATCGQQAVIAREVSRRLTTIADVEVCEAAADGRDADAVVPMLSAAEPHAVVAPPKVAAYLGERLHTHILPIEFSLEAVLSRVDAALQTAHSAAVLIGTGTVSPAAGRLLKRAGGAVHLFAWENHEHLADLVARAKRMGVQAIVGGEAAVQLAQRESLVALSLNDRSDETDGPLMRLILKAVAQVAPRIFTGRDALIAHSIILAQIAQGTIGPHDTALHLDADGIVRGVFAHRCRTGAAPDEAALIPTGAPVIEALRGAAGDFTGHAAGTELPLELDVHPLVPAGGDGYVLVLRGEPRARSPRGPLDAGAGGDDRLETLLQRVDALVERADALTRARQARRTPRRFLASLRRRTFLVDWTRVRYFELRSGLVYASLATGETYATNYTLADVAARVDPRDFFRIHRHVIVNLNYVTELERHGASQFRVAIEGTDAPSFVVSRPASAALRKLLKY